MFGRYGEFARARAERSKDSVRYIGYLVIPKIGALLSPLSMAIAASFEYRRLRRQKLEPDIVDAYYLYPEGVAAALVALWFRKPLVLSALGSDVSQIARLPLSGALIRWAIRRASAQTAVCRALVDAMIPLGAEPRTSHVVEHGVDLEIFRPLEDRAAARARLGYRRFTIISVGHLIARKGHELAIRAIAGMPTVQLEIIGSGPERARLYGLAGMLGLLDRVSFADAMDQPLLAERMGAADLLVNCSDREGIANVLIEALACGTPIAATPVWGSPEVLTSTRIGLLFEDRTTAAIARGIDAATERGWDRAHIRQHALRYSWTQTATEHRAILEWARDDYAMA
jgi:teichuronic acid biosynthesis glycosyltransferase TuaC